MTAVIESLARAGRWLLKHPAYIAIAALGVLLTLSHLDTRHWKAKAAESHNAFLLEKSAFTETVANFRGAAARAEADDLAHARAVERRDAHTSQEMQDDLTKQRDAALARVADYARRLRTGAAAGDPSSRGAADLPAAAAATGDPAGAGETAFVPAADLGICAENTVKAQGWQEWWKRITAEPR